MKLDVSAGALVLPAAAILAIGVSRFAMGEGHTGWFPVGAVAAVT